MTLLSLFIVSMLSVSAVIWTLGLCFQHVDSRAEQWSLSWAMALGLSLLIPVLGIGLLSLPNVVTTETVSAFSLHEPIQSLGQMSGALSGGGKSMTPIDMQLVATILAAIYGLGVCLNVVKLAIGRFRVRQIIRHAGPAGITGYPNALVSSRVHSPFAWTPFGRPEHSRVVLPVIYRGKISSTEIVDILRHEGAHITRRDDEMGLILRVILCLCWLSPFAHMLFSKWSQSTEIRCDMAVTASRSPEMRRVYADTLLKALHIMAGRVRQYPAASFSTHRIRNEKMRIKHIMDGTQPAYKRPRDRYLLSALAASVTVIGMLTISATANAGPAEKSALKADISSVMVTGRLTAKFGESPDPFKKGETRNHYGIDIAAPTGTPIYAPADGIVKDATDSFKGNPKYGNVVLFATEGGVVTMFSHLDGFNVKAGQKVKKGTQIATVGTTGKSTGPHVHIETYKSGQRVNPAKVWTFKSK